MAKGKRICKICGKEYEGCHTQRPYNWEFRWQDVACCPEHGQEYLKKVLIARGELQEPANEPEEKKTEPVAEALKPVKRKRKTPAKKAE